MTGLTVLAAAAAVAVPPLPEPVSNNAVAAVEIDDVVYAASFNGIDGELGHADVHANTWVFSSATGRWRRGPDVPGGEGRLASVALGVGSVLFVFGGYTVQADGSEVSTPFVHAFDPVSGSFSARAPMPVPVDDAVAFVYAERYVYLISGWHDVGNVNLVQRYDTRDDRWDQATPWPGEPVFGHAGAGVDGELLVCDGVIVDAVVRPRRFRETGACYRGRIRADDPRRIDWWALPPRPGGPCYRAAAFADGRRIVFTGGADNPYNYDGIGYDGVPAKPCAAAAVYDLDADQWTAGDGIASMDHRGAIRLGDRHWIVGGLDANRKPLATVRPVR